VNAPQVPRSVGTARVVICFVCVLSFLSAVAYIVLMSWTTPVQIRVTNYDVYRTEALKISREESASFFQIGVAVLGALWATTIVSKDNRLTKNDWPEIVMCSVASVTLVGFLFFNWRYGRLLAQLYWDMGPMLSTTNKFADINSRYVQGLHDVMQLCFYAGLALSAATVFSTCILRRTS
jgi:hypothetical protein